MWEENRPRARQPNPARAARAAHDRSSAPPRETYRAAARRAVPPIARPRPPAAPAPSPTMGTKRDAESEDYSEEPASDAPAEDASDGDYEAAPKAKKKAAPRKPAAKKKAAAAAGGDSDSDAGAAKKKAAPKKPRAKPAPKLTEPTAIGGGWTAHPPHLLVRAHPAFVGSAKVAALDLDGTLLRRPSGARFSPLDEHDWAWRNPGVPAKLKELADAGHALVIFSNQGSLKTALTGPGATKVRVFLFWGV